MSGIGFPCVIETHPGGARRKPVSLGPVSLPSRGGPRDLLVTDANRDKPADPPYKRGLGCGDDVLFRVRGWELVMGELVAVSLTGFVEGCHDRVHNTGLCQKGWEAKKQVSDI